MRRRRLLLGHGRPFAVFPYYVAPVYRRVAKRLDLGNRGFDVQRRQGLARLEPDVPVAGISRENAAARPCEVVACVQQRLVELSQPLRRRLAEVDGKGAGAPPLGDDGAFVALRGDLLLDGRHQVHREVHHAFFGVDLELLRECVHCPL